MAVVDQHGNRAIIGGIAVDRSSPESLAFSNTHREIDSASLHYALINAKGFGGNNATAGLLSPGVTERMMKSRYSGSEWQAWQAANEAVREKQQSYDEEMIAGTRMPVYKFDHNVLQDDDVRFVDQELVIGDHRISLDLASPYDDISLD